MSHVELIDAPNRAASDRGSALAEATEPARQPRRAMMRVSAAKKQPRAAGIASVIELDPHRRSGEPEMVAVAPRRKGGAAELVADRHRGRMSDATVVPLAIGKRSVRRDGDAARTTKIDTGARERPVPTGRGPAEQIVDSLARSLARLADSGRFRHLSIEHVSDTQMRLTGSSRRLTLAFEGTDQVFDCLTVTPLVEPAEAPLRRGLLARGLATLGFGRRPEDGPEVFHVMIDGNAARQRNRFRIVPFDENLLNGVTTVSGTFTDLEHRRKWFVELVASNPRRARRGKNRLTERGARRAMQTLLDGLAFALRQYN
ncbi:MAG: hypothetical protein RIC16_15905 [Rhodospirillales bacterium]